MLVNCAARTNSVKILADDSKTMTETLERALAPLLTFGSFFSLGMFEYPRGQPRPYLSFLYVLIICSFPMYFFYLKYSKTKFISLCWFIPFFHIILILISFCRFKVKILKCIGLYIIILYLLILLISYIIIFLIESIKGVLNSQL